MVFHPTKLTPPSPLIHSTISLPIKKSRVLDGGRECF
jgi:hypothetical protein